VLKNKLERLVQAIKRALSESELAAKRKLAEEALADSQERLFQAQKLARLGVWSWKADVDFVTWSEELYEMAGLDSKLPAPTYAEHPTIYTPQSWQILKTAVEKAISFREPYQLELELVRPDGSILNIIAFGGAKVDPNGKVNELNGTVQDITDRILAENRLRDSLDYLDKIINPVASPIFVKDDQHKFCLVNNALCSLLNLRVADLICKTGFEHFPSEQVDVIIANDHEVLTTGKENTNEESITDGQGKIRTIITRKTLYTDTSGN